MIDLLTEKVKSQMKDIADILDKIGERVEGNLICDITSDNLIDSVNEAKIYNIMELAKGKSKICEIGVNAGHSLLLMVSINPSAEYVIFDLGGHSYTKPCINYIRNQYPLTKITEVYGDTKISLRQAVEKNWFNKFDLIHIDGGHDTHTVVNDFIYTQPLLDKNGVVVFDDYNYHNIREVVDYYREKGIISKYTQDLIQTDLHYIYTIND
jgi:predicted O-methyltransferase YrrM